MAKVFRHGETPAARTIDARVWGTRERTGDLAAFSKLLLLDRYELVQEMRLRVPDRAVLDALSDEERGALYDEAWRAYSVWGRPAETGHALGSTGVCRYCGADSMSGGSGGVCPKRAGR